MKNIRIIARLDIKGSNVIKGIQFECLRVMGKPRRMAEEYYLQGADELIYLDTVASLYQREKLLHIVDEASRNVHIPFTIGGGVRSIEDIKELLKAGADKVAINTWAVRNPDLIKVAAQEFGSQCIVSSIEAKRKGTQKWEVYVDHGRQPTSLDVVEWAKMVAGFGAGEILLTSVDMDGTEEGLDLDLIRAVSREVSVSLIVSGGVRNPEDFARCIKECDVDGIAAGSLLHYRKYTIEDIKEELLEEGINVRKTLSSIAINTNPLQSYDIVDYNKFTLNQLRDETLNVNSGNVRIDISKNQDSIGNFDIGIIDYGLNNLTSVVRAFERIGKTTKWIDEPNEVMAAKCLVLPGVGAFKSGMDGLRRKGLIEPIIEKARNRTPFLGICLGMQLLFTRSYEFGIHDGLNLIPGEVVALKPQSEVRERLYKVPHIGWGELRNPSFGQEGHWQDSVLKNTSPQSSVYFLHSFYALVGDSRDVVATTIYGGQEFCSVCERSNITAIQFHPEKSGSAGLDILKYFCERHNI